MPEVEQPVVEKTIFSDLRKKSCQFLSASINKQMESKKFQCLRISTGNIGTLLHISWSLSQAGQA
jgi:hypothetical protein